MDPVVEERVTENQRNQSTHARPATGVPARLAADALRYPITPTANRLPYMLGGITFFAIVLLIVTGVILDQFYNPTPAGAHDSIIYIMTRVPLGNWLRALHWWGASLVLASVAAHLVWVFWRRSYAAPREVTWWSGVGLLGLLFALAFTGTVLRADQEGGEALAHAVAGADLLGALGAPLNPAFTRSAPLLTRLHSAHVSLLPLLLIALIALHFWLIRHLGIRSTRPKTRPFTTHLRKLAGYGLLIMAAVGVLAAVAPPGIGFPAVAGVEVTKPFWAFLWIYAAENVLGLWGMILAPLVLFVFLLAVPLLDRAGAGQAGRGGPGGSGLPDERSERGEVGAPRAVGRPRWVLVLGGLVFLLYLGALIYGAIAPKQAHLSM